VDKDIDDIRRRAGQSPAPESDPDLMYLLGVFSGEDGGAGFTMLRLFIETLNKQADEGDSSAEELIQVLRRFAKMVRIGTRMK